VEILAADPEMSVFRQYRCYDDFEKAALHGTFLIDAAGRIRWQDISYQPFMDTAFLLKESRRLLAIEPSTAPATTVPVQAAGVVAR
jgi:alkyl hydroperoxide reductase subunit AhpC